MSSTYLSTHNDFLDAIGVTHKTTMKLLYNASIINRPDNVTKNTIARIAKFFDVPYRIALKKRMRFLEDRYKIWIAWESHIATFPPPGPPPSEVENELLQLKKALDEDLRPKTPRLGINVTDEMITMAEHYPIENLITFVNGKAVCPFHDDARPSMYHATRKNIAMCPVCNKGWGPVKLLMDRDQMKFKEAVKALCCR